MDLVVSIDAEADGQWTHGRPLACENVRYWDAFQRLCDAHGVSPTYLVTTEIAEDAPAAALLSEWVGQARAEVGAHLHPWTTPPFEDAPGRRFNDAAHVYPSALPESLVRAKLETLTSQIEADIGVRPRCYRAGRFGMDAPAARALADLGYEVDSSVTPLVRWRDASPVAGRPPDFRHHVAKPFLIAGSGDRCLVELPVTVTLSSRWIRRHPATTGAYLSRPARVARRILHAGNRRPEPVWLRPFAHQTAADLRRAWMAAAEDGCGTAVMMFHSSELMPGGSPHRPTRRSVTGLLATLDEFFRFCVRAGATPVTMTEGARRARAGGSLPTLPL